MSANPNRLLQRAEESLQVDSSPKEKPLRTTSFVIQASRGAIRDQKTRRKTMFVLLGLALLFLFSGSTFLQSALDPREHPGRFILFWAICAWLTLAAILLAVFDLLTVKLDGRQNEKTLREKFLRSANQDSPRSTTSE
jgi:hypothetical protein